MVMPTPGFSRVLWARKKSSEKRFCKSLTKFKETYDSSVKFHNKLQVKNYALLFTKKPTIFSREIAKIILANYKNLSDISNEKELFYLLQTRPL